MDPRRARQAVEIILGLAPATFLVMPALLAAAFGTVMAAAANPPLDAATAMLLGWILAASIGLATLWIVVVLDMRRVDSQSKAR